MTTFLMSVMLVPALANEVELQSFAEARYSGALVSRSRDGEGGSVKDFSVYCLFRSDGSSWQDVGFLVDERGGSSWAWPERFGTYSLDAQHDPPENPVRVLHNHDGVMYPLPLPSPVFGHREKLAPDAAWQHDRKSYHVVGTEKVDDRQCWKITVDVSTRPKQTIYVEQGSGLLVASEDRVFMGRGDEFVLRIKLDSLEELTQSEFARIRKPLDTLVTLQNEIDRADDATDPELTDEQLQLAKASLEQIHAEAASTPFDRLSDVIARDVQAQLERSDNVAGLAKKFVGKPAPKYELSDAKGAPLESEQRDGKIVVLHFWKYHDDPLSEPYGQVGYLDFLNSRRNKLGVEVYGVAIDENLANAGKRSGVLRQMRKFQEFMNFDYPIAIDDGELLEKFGDPRRLGANLPLWIVIDSEGTVSHYHAGYYDVKPDEGLHQLDAVVVELLKQQHEAQ